MKKADLAKSRRAVSVEARQKMTIDDLAIMVAKGFEGIDKEIGEVKDRLGKVEDNLASTRRDVLALGDKFTVKYEFHDLANRVSLLEQKQKTKR